MKDNPLFKWYTYWANRHGADSNVLLIREIHVDGEVCDVRLREITEVFDRLAAIEAENSDLRSVVKAQLEAAGQASYEETVKWLDDYYDSKYKGTEY